MNKRNIVAATLVALIATIVGCQRGPEAPASGSQPRAWEAGMADRAALVEQLPAETVAYLRIPTPWGLAAAPKDSAVGQGLDTAANREAIAALQARLPEMIEAELGQLAPMLTLLLESMRSPLEIALVGEGPQPLEADLVIEARFAFETATELDAALAGITSQAAMLELLEPSAGEGPGQILATMFPIFYEFDEQTQRARFLTGMAASPEALAESRSWKAPESSPIAPFEQRIDASRLGFFLWADTDRLAPLMRQGLDEGQLAQFEELGVFSTRQLALGYGSSEGTGRLAVLAEGDEGRAWSLTLPAAGPVEVASSGVPDAAVGLMLPGTDWLRRALTAFGEDADARLAGVSESLEKELGLDLATLVDTFAGRLIYVDDDNGSYLVHEGGGVERWRQFWEVVSRRFDVRQTTTRVGDSDIHHIVIPGFDLGDSMGALGADNPVMALVMRKSLEAGTHLFWMSEDDRILMAAVPQVLMSRLAHPGTVSVDDWLNRSGVDTARAGLFGALRINEAPRRNYYTYISWLLVLADMLETDLDVTDFPTARELDLPDTGTVGFGIDFADGRLGATLTFENHPGDLLYAGGGSFGGLAALGVLTAVAVPAYQDYTVRARVATAFAATGDFRALTERYVAEHAALPDAELARQWAGDVVLGPEASTIEWDENAPALVVFLSGGSNLPENPRLMLVPQLADGELAGWHCKSPGLEPKYLPAGCR